MEKEREVLLKGKTLEWAWDELHKLKLAHKAQDPMMLVVLGHPYSGHFDGALKAMHTNADEKRVADEENRGTLEVLADKKGIRIIFRRGRFPDGILFWETVNTLLAELGVTIGSDKPLPDLAMMKEYYEDYSPTTASKIIKAFPVAYGLYCDEGGRWGPGYIARVCGLNSRTIGRYLSAFKKAGIREISSIEIP